MHESKIRIRCSECGHAGVVSASKSGAKVKCPQCSAIIIVPSTPSSPPAIERTSRNKSLRKAVLFSTPAIIACVVGFGIWNYSKGPQLSDVDNIRGIWELIEGATESLQDSKVFVEFDETHLTYKVDPLPANDGLLVLRWYQKGVAFNLDETNQTIQLEVEGFSLFSNGDQYSFSEDRLKIGNLVFERIQPAEFEKQWDEPSSE